MPIDRDLVRYFIDSSEGLVVLDTSAFGFNFRELNNSRHSEELLANLNDFEGMIDESPHLRVSEKSIEEFSTNSKKLREKIKWLNRSLQPVNRAHEFYNGVKYNAHSQFSKDRATKFIGQIAFLKRKIENVADKLSGKKLEDELIDFAQLDVVNETLLRYYDLLRQEGIALDVDYKAIKYGSTNVNRWSRGNSQNDQIKFSNAFIASYQSPVNIITADSNLERYYWNTLNRGRNYELRRALEEIGVGMPEHPMNLILLLQNGGAKLRLLSDDSERIIKQNILRESR